jgi:hypothetical protein
MTRLILFGLVSGLLSADQVQGSDPRAGRVMTGTKGYRFAIAEASAGSATPRELVVATSYRLAAPIRAASLPPKIVLASMAAPSPSPVARFVVPAGSVMIEHSARSAPVPAATPLPKPTAVIASPIADAGKPYCEPRWRNWDAWK